MSELGQWLRETREGKRLSLEQVEEATRIRRRFLQALEEGTHAALPTPMHVRGFVRNYAQYLGLDVTEVLALYDSETREEEEPPEPGLFHPADITLSPTTWLRLDQVFAVLIVVAIILVGGWAARKYLLPGWSFTLPWLAAPRPTSVAEAGSSPQAIPSPTTAPTNTPSPTLTISPTPTIGPTLVATEVTLQVNIVDRAWLLVEVDGVKVHEGIMEVGTTESWQGRHSIYLRCGNAGGVEATVNGESLGNLGERGEVVDLYWGPQGQITPTVAITPIVTGTVTITVTPTGTVTTTVTPTVTPSETVTLTVTPELTITPGAETEVTASPQPTEATTTP
jgi:cytoskeletal protein RodZ